MIEGLRSVRNVLARDPDFGAARKKKTEIAQIGLVGTVSSAAWTASKVAPRRRLLPAKLARATLERMSGLCFYPNVARAAAESGKAGQSAMQAPKVARSAATGGVPFAGK